MMCECVVVSSKHEVYSLNSLPLSAVSGIICRPGLSSSSLQRKTPHKLLVQGTCNSSSQCSSPLLTLCPSNEVIQNKTGRFVVILKSGKV